MTDTPESIKIKMLEDAGYTPIPIQKNYVELIEFVRSISNNYRFDQSEEEFMKFYIDKENEAYLLLKKLGEIE